MLNKDGLVTESPNNVKQNSSKKIEFVTSSSRNLQISLWKDDIFY